MADNRAQHDSAISMAAPQGAILRRLRFVFTHAEYVRCLYVYNKADAVTIEDLGEGANAAFFSTINFLYLPSAAGRSARAPSPQPRHFLQHVAKFGPAPRQE